MSFDYQMTADGSQAVAESKRVESSLVDVEGAAKRVGTAARDAFGRFTGSKLQTEMSGAASGANALASSFAGIARAMAAEEAMLTRIKGPLREYSGQLNVLDALLGKSKISTSEYANEVARLNRELERSAHLPQGGGGPSPKGGGGGGVLGGHATGASIAIMGQLTAAAASAAHAVLEMGDSYVSMKNRLQGVTTSQAGLNSLLDSTFAIAQRTRSSWDSTNESFVRLTNSTKALGLEQPQVLDLTETIAKAVKMSGASASEASSGMLQLSQAFSSGTLQGDEFRTLAEAMPSMLDIIAKQMGKPRGELKDLASQGKITSDVLVRSFQGAKASIDAGFAKTAPTLADAWAMFKNEVTKAIGETDLVGKLMPVIVQATEGFVMAIKNLADTLGPVLSLLGQLGPVIKVASGAMKIFNEYINPLGVMKNVGGAAIDFFSKVKLKSLPPIDPQINEEYTKHQEKLTKIRDTMALIGDQRPFIDSKIDATELEKKLDEIDKKRAMEKMADAAARVYDRIHGVNGELEKMLIQLSEGPAHIKKLEGALEAWNKKIVEKRSMSVHFLPSPEEVRMGFDLAREIERAKMASKLGPVVAKVKQDELDLEYNIGNLKMALTAGDITQAQYAKGLKSLGVEMSALEKLLVALRQPQKDFDDGMRNLELLFDSGRISVLMYITALDKLRDAHKGLTNLGDIIDTAAGKYDKLRATLQRPMRPLGSGISFADNEDKEIDIDTAIDAAQRQRRGETVELQKPRDETTFAGFLKGSEPVSESFAEYEVRMARLAKSEEEVLKLELQLRKERADAGPDLAKTYDAWEKQNQKIRESTILTIKWKAEMRKLNEDAGQRLGRGMAAGLQEIKDQIFDIEKATKNLVSGAFTELNSALAKSLVAGEGWAESFGEALKKIEEMLVALALQIIQISILQAIFKGGGVSPIAGFAREAIHAVDGGSHDDGGLFRVGGHGGVDTQNVMMRVSSGEHVGIWPRGTAPGGMGGGSMRIVNVFDRREITQGMSSRDGDRVMHNFIRQNPGAVRSRMRRRN